jgi:hypothetical protein
MAKIMIGRRWPVGIAVILLVPSSAEGATSSTESSAPSSLVKVCMPLNAQRDAGQYAKQNMSSFRRI